MTAGTAVTDTLIPSRLKSMTLKLVFTACVYKKFLTVWSLSEIVKVVCDNSSNQLGYWYANTGSGKINN